MKPQLTLFLFYMQSCTAKKLVVNIVSEGRLLEKGLTITKTSKDGCLIKQGKNVIMTARIQNKLTFVDRALNSSGLADLRRFR